VPTKWHRPAWAPLSCRSGPSIPAKKLARYGPRGRVTNPNLRGGYVTITSDVLGKVTTRTLLAGPDHPGRRTARCLGGRAWQTVPWCSGQGLTITAAGTPLENAAIGDFIRVRNIESGLIVPAR
jgi:hypothetical protein